MKKLLLAILVFTSISSFAEEQIGKISGLNKLRSFITAGGDLATECFLPLMNSTDFKLLIASGHPLKSLMITKDEKRNLQFPYRFTTIHGDSLIMGNKYLECKLTEQDLEIINTLKD